MYVVHKFARPKAKENQKVPLTKIFLAASFERLREGEREREAGEGGGRVAKRGSVGESGVRADKSQVATDCEHSLEKPESHQSHTHTHTHKKRAEREGEGNENEAQNL